jgi:hypothetical protein
VAAWAAYGGSPSKVTTPVRAIVLVEGSGAVGLARAARDPCGGGQGEARVPWHGNCRNPQLGGSIYRGFWPPS